MSTTPPYRKLDGTVIHRSASYKDLQLLSKRKTLLWERREDQFLPRMNSEVSLVDFYD